MSRVHYFARYSQRENIVTNNTLLLFNRLYSDSNEKFNRFLKSLLFEEEELIDLDTRVKFEQQVKIGNSVPDGLISQKSFKIVIESKLHKQENLEQILNHLSAFDNEDVSIFLFIGKNRISNKFRNDIREAILLFNEKNAKDIKFIATTFKKICNKFEEVIDEYDFDLIEIIDDYREFCLETGIINNYDTKMRVVPTGTSLNQNIKYNIYYHPSSRGYQDSKYIGLYTKKAVRAVGMIETIADVDLDDGEIRVKGLIKGQLDEKMKEVLIDVIKQARENFQYNLKTGTRFFFVKKFYETLYKKETKGPLPGTKYFDFTEIDGYLKNMTTEEIAELLKKRTWG